MRNSYPAVIILIIGCLILTGCQNDGQENPQSGIGDEPILIEAVPSDSLATGELTLLEQFSHDLNLDGSPETIELYTAAERHESGEIIWDDGQEWLLLVRAGDKAYPLFSKYVQIGMVYFTVSEASGEEVPHITAMVSTGAGLSLRTYTFAKDRDAFQEEIVYTSPDDNFLFNSIPAY